MAGMEVLSAMTCGCMKADDDNAWMHEGGLSCTDLLAVQTHGNLIRKSGSHSREMTTSNGTGH